MRVRPGRLGTKGSAYSGVRRCIPQTGLGRSMPSILSSELSDLDPLSPRGESSSFIVSSLQS
jgi:hypothetical protein